MELFVGKFGFFTKIWPFYNVKIKKVLGFSSKMSDCRVSGMDFFSHVCEDKFGFLLYNLPVL